MDKNHISVLKATEAAEVLDRAGLLKDNMVRKGLPLRNKLRAGEFGELAYQVGRFWYIKRSNNRW